MNIEHKEFVGFYHELFPAGYCQYLITEFNRLEEGGIGSNRQRGEGAHKHVKDDYQIGINLRSHNLEPFKWMEGETEFNRDGCDLFFDGLQKCYDEYSSKYSILRENGNIRASTMKMQRTGPGGGYHVWHGEQGPGTHANRAVVYMLYLNDPRRRGRRDRVSLSEDASKARRKPHARLACFLHSCSSGQPGLGRDTQIHRYGVVLL
jgi:hypothetical protein